MLDQPTLEYETPGTPPLREQPKVRHLDYIPKPEQPDDRFRFVVIVVANVVTLVIGTCLFAFIVSFDDGVARKVQALLTCIMLVVQAMLGLLSVLAYPRRWMFPAASFALHLTNVALVYILPTSVGSGLPLL